jgi:hypothetical protein
MESFISILSVQTNAHTNENVVVGLLAVSSNSIFFDYSKTKVAFAQKISGSQQLGVLALSLLKKIEHQVKQETDPQTKLIFTKSKFISSYFKYLNDYSAGALKFSEPVIINKVFDDHSYLDYYLKFVGEKSNHKPSVATFKSKLKKYFSKEGLNQKADIAYKVNPEQFKGVYNDTTIPLITKNGVITAVQFIDFESSKEVCANHLYQFTNIHYGLSDFCINQLNIPTSKMKIVCVEPDLSSDSHKVFELAAKESSDIFEFINPDQLGQYTDDILNSNNVSFSSLLGK